MTDDELKQVKETFVRLCQKEMLQMPDAGDDLSELAEWSNRIPEGTGPRPLTKNCT
jgi:hypothetical protein